MPEHASPSTNIQRAVAASRSGFARCCSFACLLAVGCAEQPPASHVATSHLRLISEPQLVTEGEPEVTDRFGTSVAISGGRIALGAPTQVVDGQVVGTVSLYRQQASRWEQEQLLAGPGEPSESSFGRELSLVDDLLVVGAPSYDEPTSNHGIVYVYQRSEDEGWQLSSSLGADLEVVSGVGDAVATNGSTIFVGVNAVEVDGDRQGAVIVYETDPEGNWVEVQRLLSSVDRAGFGSSLVMQGDTAVVGNLVAEAFVFERDPDEGWQERRVLRQDRTGTGFSSSLALFGDVLAVGASSDNETGATRGAISIFERSVTGWELRQKLLPDPETLLLALGASLAMSDDLLVSGAPNTVVGDRVPGAAAVYQRDAEGEWFESQRLLPSNLDSAFSFGAGVALSGQTLVICDPGFTNHRGTAHIYTAVPDPLERDAGGAPTEPAPAGDAAPRAEDAALGAEDVTLPTSGSSNSSGGGCRLVRAHPTPPFGYGLVLSVITVAIIRRRLRWRAAAPKLAA